MARSSDSGFIGSIFRDKTFQAREIRRVLLLTCMYLGVTTVLVGVFYNQMLGQILEGAAPLLFVSEDMALVNEAVPTLSAVLGKWLIAMLVVNALITVSLATYITRKLGHPLLAIKRALRQIGDGRLDVRLRAADNNEFGDIAKELTLAVHSIREQIAAAKSGINQVGTVAETSKDATELDTAINDCRHALDFFQMDIDESIDPKKAA
ncbi:methyl-accepting chemotaxis protein [Granulosicoccus sp.]|nr:methyl-accepting chemotaxis protein [Granulosicoccus sp.]MDB4223798.1 methyl-accepting chemotaxis protein [Granulosicoccus sp.]